MVQHGNTQHGGEQDEGGGSEAGAAWSDAEEAGPHPPVRLVAGAYLLTVNAVDGSEIEPCPSSELPGGPRKLSPDERSSQGPAATLTGGTPAGVFAIPMLEREEERERLARQLARGRSVRLTGPSGAGRTTLLNAVAEDVAGLAPDGVVRLSGYHRTPEDLLQELFSAVHDAPRHRPSVAEIRAALHDIGAVVIIDDLAFGGAALDQLLDATPECAFLLAATPDVAAPSADVHVEEVPLTGLSRTGCLELLELAVRRPLTNEETDAAGDLWFGSEGIPEGLPLRFVQAGALLRHGSAEDLSSCGDAGMSALVAGQLSGEAREALRFALSLGGELPHHTRLPALTGEPQAGDAVAELAGAGLVTAAGARFRLAAGVSEELNASGHGDGTDDRALSAAHHYSWWTGHGSAGAERVGAEADAVLAAVHGAHRGGHASAAVLLARTAAPVLAGTLRWSAWERVLRAGQEAARTSGEVAEEAYFHHELGVLALCGGQLQRAHAELDASIALRGALADQQGTIAGRRALALVTDAMAAVEHEQQSEDGFGHAAPPSAAPAAVPIPEPEPQPASPADEAPTSRLAGAFRQGSGARHEVRRDEAETARTVAATARHRTDDGAGGKGGTHAAVRSRRPSRRGNMAAAGAGAVLMAVLGTIMGLGSMPDDGPGPSDRGNKPGSSSTQPEESDLNADDPESGSPESKDRDSKKPSSSSTAPGASDSASGPRPSDSSSEPGEEPSGSEPGGAGGSNGSGGSDNGGTDSGGSDGGTDDGGTSDGGTDSGGADDGGTSDGGTDSGGTDGGTDDGGTSDGGTDSGGTDSGGTDSGGTSDGGTDSGGTDSGGTSDGGTGSPSPTESPIA
ncbi:MAG TPA: ATP-binding protein [Streptomyces sp.]|nr:ATP-binding protein [Streptomyces sp.]